MGKPRRRTPEQLLKFLLENVYIEGDCRIWAGQYNGGQRGQYPQVCVNRHNVSVRPLLFKLLGRELPPAHYVVNSCGDRRCIAPKHLLAMPRSEVMRRAVLMGRVASGMKRSREIILSNAQRAKFPVTEMHNALRMLAEGMTREEVARHYGIAPGQLGRSLRKWQAAGFNGWIPPRRDDDGSAREEGVAPATPGLHCDAG